MLAAGTLAQTAYASMLLGVAVVAPSLRAHYGLSLGQIGFLIAAPSAGAVVSLLPWGVAADRLGERLVLVIGVGAAGLALLAAAHAATFEALLALFLLAGLAGASVNSASGRAVAAWFPPEQRGFALAVRQTAVPIGGLATAVALPPLVHAHGVGSAFTALGVAALLGAAVAGLVLRDIPAGTAHARGAPGVSPYRSRPLWLLSIGSALVIAPQVTLVGFTVVFLHAHRALTSSGAAAVFAVVQLLGIPGRLAAGRWSDVVGSHVRPLRAFAFVMAVLLAATAAAVDAPLAVLFPVLVVAGVVSISWNSLSFAGAIELAGAERSGAAIGLQQTLLGLAGSIYPVGFGFLVAASSWRVGIVVVAVLPLAGWLVLGRMRG